MATAQERFEGLLNERLAPWLNELGFKRRDTTFRRRSGEAWQIVNVQRSQANTANRSRFTVNLGAGLAFLHDDDPPWARRGWPLEYECDFRTRLGVLARGDDHWWSIGRVLPLGGVADDVRGDLERHGLPWLELHADTPRYLKVAVGDPTAVDAGNLAALVRLAELRGGPEDVRIAEAELARWQRGGRSAW